MKMESQSYLITLPLIPPVKGGETSCWTRCKPRRYISIAFQLQYEIFRHSEIEQGG